MDDLAEIIDDLRKRIVDLERRARSQSRTGVITEVDPENGLARVELMDQDLPFQTGWLPWEETAAGANRTHIPPSIGQQVKVNSENGDLTDGTIRASLNSSAYPRPSSAGDEYVLASVGDASIRIIGGGASIELKVGDVTHIVSSGGVEITDGQVTHNGKNVGDTHKHEDVVSGSSLTGPPN